MKTLSRKQKLKKIGRKINKKTLKRLLASFQIIHHKYPISSDILPYEFCPMCGCKETIGGHERSCYPESYKLWFCARCEYLVAMVDNSPRIHCLECKDYEI